MADGLTKPRYQAVETAATLTKSASTDSRLLPKALPKTRLRRFCLYRRALQPPAKQVLSVNEGWWTRSSLSESRSQVLFLWETPHFERVQQDRNFWTRLILGRLFRVFLYQQSTVVPDSGACRAGSRTGAKCHRESDDRGAPVLLPARHSGSSSD